MISYAITAAIILLGGSFVLANIKTDRGISLYDVVAGTLKIEIESIDSDNAVEKGLSAIQSTLTALGDKLPHKEQETVKENVSTDSGEGMTASPASQKAAPAKSGSGQAADKTEGQPAAEEQPVPEGQQPAEGQPLPEEQTLPEEQSVPEEQPAAEQTAPEEAFEEVQEEPETDSGSYRDGYAAQVLELVNQERASVGLEPLTWNSAAASGAKIRASEIVGQFSHARPGGSAGLSVLNECGASYNCAGENLAAGQSSAGEVVSAWMNSPSHRANILKPEFTSLGIACYYVPGSEMGYYWVQMFVG